MSNAVAVIACVRVISAVERSTLNIAYIYLNQTTHMAHRSMHRTEEERQRHPVRSHKYRFLSVYCFNLSWTFVDLFYHLCGLIVISILGACFVVVLVLVCWTRNINFTVHEHWTCNHNFSTAWINNYANFESHLHSYSCSSTSYFLLLLLHLIVFHLTLYLIMCGFTIQPIILWGGPGDGLAD